MSGTGTIGRANSKKDNRQTVDPQLLKELAKKVEGMPAQQGVEVLMKELEKQQPDLVIPQTPHKKSSTPPPPTKSASAATSASKIPADDPKKKVTRENSRRGVKEEDQKISEKFPKQQPAAKRQSQRQKAPIIIKALAESEQEKQRRLKYESQRSADALELDQTQSLVTIQNKAESESQRLSHLVSLPDARDILAPHLKQPFDFDDFRYTHNLVLKLNQYQQSSVEPEVVIVGMTSTGKSQLLEAILGFNFNYVNFKKTGASKRPLWIHLISNENCSQPRFIIQAETDKKSEVINVQDLQKELARISDSTTGFSLDPIYLQIEYRYCFNMVLVDVPGLPYSTEGEEFGQLYSYIEDTIRPAHRFIIYVEEANQTFWDTQASQQCRQLIARYDPSRQRTAVIYTKFNSYIDSQISSQDLQRYFTKNSGISRAANASATTFFVTLLSQKERENILKTNSLLERLVQIEQRDRNRLDILNADLSIVNNHVGINRFRQFLVDRLWKDYNTSQIPRLFENLKTKKKDLLKVTEKQETILKNLNLKGWASNYASRYLQLVQSVLVGNAKANPQIHGETLRQEKDQQYFASSEWEISDSNLIPFLETKIYGGMQFERLFAEFRAVVNQLEISDSDLRSLPSKSDKQFFWTACEIAGDRSEELFVNLIQQITERASFIMKRIPIIAETILGSKDFFREQLPIPLRHFAPLATHIRDLFSQFVDKQLELCKTKCMEELYPTKTIAWYLTDQVDVAKFKDDKEVAVEIFNRIKDRISKNVVRKIYNLLIIPFMDASLWNEIQTNIFCMDEVTLDEIFDRNSIEDSLDRQLEELEQQIEAYHESDLALRDIVAKF